MKLTYSVKALIRLDKKRADGTCPICYSLRVGDSPVKISSTKFIDPKDWDSKNRKPKASGKDGKLLAQYLNDQTNGFYTAMLKHENLGKTVTLIVAKEYFKGVPKMTLFEFWDLQVSKWRHKLSPNTIKSYDSVLRILKQFNSRLDFGDLSPILIEHFDEFLATKRGNSLNGRFVKHKCFRSILYKAIANSYLEKNPYKGFPIEQEEVERESLTVDEVNVLISTPIPDKMPNLYAVRDLFLFSCYTGLRYSDVINIRTGDIKIDKSEPRLEIKVIKTQNKLIVPLHEEALQLIKRYIGVISNLESKLVFPTISNPVINRALKDLMVVAGIQKNISFHCGRHTFACNHLEAGTRLIQVSKLLGHKSIKQTQIYAKPTTEDLNSSVRNMALFYNSKKTA